MPQETTWGVRYGQYSGATLSLTDFTSRTLGLFVDQQCDPGQLGTGICEVTLDNSDGELTPGGSGTYASFDWLASGCFIQATNSFATTVQVFHGVVTDFRLDDDGEGRSVVVLTSYDAFSVIGRQDSFQYSMTNSSTADMLFDLTSPHLLLNSTKVPTLGLATMRTWWEELNASTESVAHDLPTSAGKVVLGDIINNSVMPNEQTVAFPTILDTDGDYVASDSWVGFTVDGLARANITATGNVFKFSEPLADGTMLANDLPFRRLVRDFHLDLITNAATVTALDGGTAQSYSDVKSQERYGTRARSYETTSTSDARALYTAQLWVNRYSYDEQIEMTASSLQVTDGMVRATEASVGVWISLLNVEKLWETGQVTYTPTGGSQRGDEFIIAGRRIEATPDDTVVTLKVRPQNIYLAFILDDPDRGVLDTNKLG